MRLKRIELQGFKSFADRTVMEFDDGVTAILGPNGCGKSNVVDAIRWVLGEQSAKQLRGERMEDIIFKGTARRKPVGLCEVSLVFTNEDRGLPIDFDEVSIKRRVSRDGFSQYYLNNAPVRLRDLRDLFFDSGINNTAYSVIEQEKISRVLSENTTEVRLLVEEGAGIVKYKVRRREAQRKLDRTEQDLLRLRDLVEEIGREVRSLKRQVGKARRYQRLYRQIRSLDLLIAGRRWQELDGREQELRRALDTLSVDAEADTGELNDLRAKVETARPAVDEREAERQGLEESLNAFQEEMKAVEQRMLLGEHRINDHEQRLRENGDSLTEIEDRRGALRAEIHDLDRRRQALERTGETLTVDLNRLEEELRLVEDSFDADRKSLEEASQLNIEFIESDNKAQSELRELEIRLENRRDRLRIMGEESDRLEEQLRSDTALVAEQARERENAAASRRDRLGELLELEKTLQAAQQKRRDLDAEVSKRDARREALKSRYEVLKKIRDDLHGFSVAAKNILQRRGEDPGILGSLADGLRVSDPWSAAIEVLLDGILDAILVSDRDKAMDLVAEARESACGRISLLLGDAAEGPDGRPEPSDGGVRADRVVEGPGAANPHVRALLSRCWLYDSDEAARRAAATADGGTAPICVSRTGLLISTDGVMRGGQGRSEETSLLGREEKLEELSAEVAGVEGEIADLQRRAAENETRISELTARVQTGREELETINEDISRLHADAAATQSGVRSGRERIEKIAADRRDLENSLLELESKRGALSATLDASGRRRDSSTLQLDEMRARVKSGEAERDGTRQALAERQLERSRLQGETRELAGAIAHREESLAELAANETRLRQENELGEQELVSLRTEVSSLRETLSSGAAELEKRRLLVSAAGEAIAELHEETAAWHDRIREIETVRGECREQIHKHETEMATLEVRRANLCERVEQQYKGRFRELIRSIDPESLPRELEMDEEVFQLEQANALLEDARRKLSSLGAVNHLAIEEYEQKSERLTFLETQLTDVEKAREDLVSTIQRINTTARKLFQETFEEVRRNYIAVFQTLFEGGQADLELLRTDDPLEGNIRIIAQPKGKRVDSIRLLSGGERCLTALSILFAVYLVKPSPFCLLDEADAPLDDSNVGRFVTMLKEFSRGTQFLVVTHNKLTMETANHMYGVTMMEQGVSSLVSVSFDDVASFQTEEELGQAIADRRRDVDTQEEEKAVLAAETPAVEETAASRFMLGENGSAAGTADDAAADEAVENNPDDDTGDGDTVAMEAD